MYKTYHKMSSQMLDKLLHIYKISSDNSDTVTRLLSDAYNQGYNDAEQSHEQYDINCDVLKVIDRLDAYSIKEVDELFHCGANGDKRIRYSYILRNFTVHEINMILDGYDRKVDIKNIEIVANHINKFICDNYSSCNIKAVVQKLAEMYDDKED